MKSKNAARKTLSRKKMKGTKGGGSIEYAIDLGLVSATRTDRQNANDAARPAGGVR